MALGVSRQGIGRNGRPKRAWRWAVLALVPTSISCVPAGNLETPATPTSRPLPTVPTADASNPAAAILLDRTQSILTALARGGDAFAFRGRTAVDQLRSLDCLAQAIHYEAASESEDGQRAVAQVVLNRVRHPAWPNSVCGVVYQGPMRPGGGCQFTFTCDGSLARPAGGIAWARARALAAEALAGRAYAPAGSSTHYHTHAVSPSWAPRLRPTLSIGAHAFYRLPGAAGEPSAFTAAYKGREPLPQPSMILVRPAVASSAPAFASLPTALPRAAALPAPAPLPSDLAATSGAPESTVREEYRSSGQWRDDAPAAITGR
jgi:spore germination cell wall hydrolase CwlJ-like protein